MFKEARTEVSKSDAIDTSLPAPGPAAMDRVARTPSPYTMTREPDGPATPAAVLPFVGGKERPMRTRISRAVRGGLAAMLAFSAVGVARTVHAAPSQKDVDLINEADHTIATYRRADP